MGKTKVKSPRYVTGALAAEDSLQSLSSMFGVGERTGYGYQGGFGSIFDAQSYFDRLGDAQFDRRIKGLKKSGEFAREESSKNLQHSLGLKGKSLDFIRSEKSLSKFLDFDARKPLLDSVSSSINDQLAARGIGASPIGGAIAGTKLGVMGHQIQESDRARRLSLASSIIGGSVPTPQGSAGVGTPQLFSSPVFNQPLNFQSAFGAATNFIGGNRDAQLELNAANAQFRQQFKNDIGKSFGGSIFGGTGGNVGEGSGGGGEEGGGMDIMSLLSFL